ncbi:MAG: acetate--CoA ligase [Epsilonproteobacteria bacterium]|uniref:acetate--CoA ligase n=1 Tax=Sulfurospirillum TaxID=57665 RepID=UPI0005A84F73|nr:MULTISPECIES: acetate--CoA ligase [Sulfurospirillum]MCP3650783.1 acetate--CoA ligase [Sulfurospirillum sp. DNRA8]MCR1809628.1 acetate--CoA ligase [Sulfurospirillum sp. DNRA8]MDY0264691.1 acetate--CoA ligase [Sulfurospirillum cavolei]NCB53391.1 acetate--CoA ligase [Campylobacterota bacterium]
MSHVFEPNRTLSKEARIKNMCEYKELCIQADENFEGYWDKLAREKIEWFKPYDRVLNEDNAPFYKWFEGGKLNVTHQCLGRHLNSRKNKAAIIWEGEDGKRRIITYLQLFYRVNRLANLMRNRFGIKKGDRVVLYMPMIPEAAFAMLACAKIGAIHSVVFGGFSADALRDRIQDAQAKLVITADGAFRRGKPYMLKPVVDEALKEGCECCDKVLIVQRNFEDIEYVPGRDYVYNEIIMNESQYCEPEWMDAEDPLFLLYTSGSTGKPKGVQHSSAGYILWAQYTMEHVFDVKENDTFWCTADVGWITGHTYIVYGPLAMGATTIMYEGVPTFPDVGRWWSMIEEHRVNQFYTAPTAIRLLHKEGADAPKRYDLSSLKVLGTVGEPINPDAWMWYYEEIGGGRCPIVDTWWQTETGGHMITPLPGATPIKPGSATFPLPGIKAEILDEHGQRVSTPHEKGFLCITRPWPSMIRNIWGDSDRFVKSYFGDHKKDGVPVYFSGDGAMYDEDGYIIITGRTDDVINVSGHRIGTAEIEAVLGHHENVAEVAVVGRPDPIKGEGIFAYIVIKGDDTIGEEVYMIQELNKLIVKEIGNIAKLDAIRFVPGLPKTRSGKIMRRILRSIAKKEPITQDISTLEDPSIVEKIQNLVQF